MKKGLLIGFVAGFVSLFTFTPIGVTNVFAEEEGRLWERFRDRIQGKD